MATRMQQRRGTAAQWSSSNPTLGAGEIGWESDTNKFKIGDGTNQWNDLDYFVDQASLNTSLGDYVETTTLEQPNGVATLDSNAKLKTSQLPDVALVTVHAVADQAARLALSVEPGDIAIQTDNGQTYVLSASPASTNGNWTAITVADPFPTKDTDDLAEGTTNKYFTNQRALDATSAAYEPSGSVSTHSSDTTNVHGIADTSKLVKTDSLSTTLDGDLVVDGDFTVNGTNFAASATSIVIEDNLVQLAHQNSGNIVDLGIVVGYNDGTAKHAGIVRDVSSDKWKLFKGVTTEPSTTVDFTQGTLDDLEVAGLVASSATIGDVSNTELQYLNGVTSSIQTQLDAKLDSTTASSTYLTQSSASSVYAPLASPTFTGTVTLPSGTVTSTMIADGTIVDADINASAAIAKTKIAGTAITAADTGTVTNAMLAGSIANNKLANSSITINGSAVSLGGSTTISATPTMNEQVFISNGTFTVPAGVTKIEVDVQGGGGGGAGSPSSYAYFGGWGGGQGMFYSRVLSVTPGANLAVTVGGGGGGGGSYPSATDGGAGGTSSISSISAAGGNGGRVMYIYGSNVSFSYYTGENGSGPGAGRGGTGQQSCCSVEATSATANSGSGGGGAKIGSSGGSGGSGHVVVRWLS